MLVVKQLDTPSPAELLYECYDNVQPVGRLQVTLQVDGNLQAQLFDTKRPEAARTLMAKLERDALAHNMTGLYLLARDQKEATIFEPAHYEPVEEGSLTLYKKLG